MTIIKATLILAAAAVLVSTGAAAQSSALRVVNHADLDLSTQSGVSTLERRIARAVKSLCSHDPAVSGALVDAEQAQCEAETAAAVRAQIDARIATGRSQKLRTAGL